MTIQIYYFKMIPWNNPKFGTKELELVKEVLESGYVSEGPKTKELEEKLSKICNAKHIIMTTSATAALYLAIEADKRIRNYKEGEVIIPNLTFIATKNAVEQAGLSTTIKDVREEDYLLRVSVDTIPKIWLSVNLLGRKGCEMTYPSTLICDNAGCLGSNVPNGKVGCYSLQSNKLLTCGQGGFCATDDDEYAKVIRQLKDFGREDKYDQHTKGFNFKFNDIQASVVLGQLELLDMRRVSNINLYHEYCRELKDYGKFIDYKIDFDLDKTEVPLWIEFITDKRDELFDYLKSKGIEARKPWKPIIDDKYKYPNTDYYCKNCLWLPCGPTLNGEQFKEVINVIKEFYEK
jgi:perosamine synthetase